MANKILGFFKAYVAFSRRTEIVQLTYLAHIRFIGIRFPINYHLEELYGPVGRSENEARKSIENGPETDLARTWLDPGQYNGRAESTPIWSTGLPRQISQPPFSPKVKRRLLICFKVFDLFRVISTVWLIYVLIKFFLDDRLAKSLPIKFDLPLHCYLAGRLIVYEGLSDIIACQFAILHLSWRLSQNIPRPFYKLRTINFLIMNQQDIERVYSRFRQTTKSGSSGGIILSAAKFDQLNNVEKLILDTMCSPIWHNAGVVHKLRYNRTQRKHEALKNVVAGLLFSAIILRTLAEMTIHSLVFQHISSDATYAKLYPNCGHPRGWHRYYSFFMDMVENIILYTEGGIVWSAAGAILLLNCDLIMFWLGIEKKINQLLVEISELRLVKVRANSRRQQRFQRDVNELIARMCDFFEQVSRADEVISVFLAGLLGASLLTCSVFTYYTRDHVIRRVPFQVGLMAAFVLSWILTAAYGFLRLNSICSSSYVRLCSLIARDRWKSQHNYQAVLDYFNRQRSCFTLLNGVPFRQTTLLAMIGWTFSCFCIITSTLRDNDQLELIARGYHSKSPGHLVQHPVVPR